MARHLLSVTKLLVIFIMTFSLGSLSGSLAGQLHLPALQVANALPAPCNTHGSSGSCSEYWYPSGAAMDTLQTPIFTDSTAELANLQSATPSIDLTDLPLPPSLISPLNSNPNFYVTSAVSDHSYYDLEFLLANNFWGINFNFGNDTNGVQVRQGISHMIDKNAFVANDASIAGVAIALDNPVPPNNGGLASPNPCQWDSSFPQTGSNCIVGSPGGTAYHLASASGADGYSWLYAPGSSDLNAAAQHFVNAGIATGFNSTTSVLTGVSAAAAAHTVNFFIRNDDPPRLDLGNSMAAQICYLFTGSYVTPCPYLTVTRGPITAFCLFADCCISTSICLTWGIYTGSYSEVFPFDSSLYYTYNGRFVNGIPSIKISGGGLCSNSSVPTVSPSDYIYLCDPTYDSLTSQMEFASSLSSAIGFGEQAADRFGSHAFSIPIFGRTDSFAYLNNWQRVVNDDGAGVPNSFTWLGAYSPNPSVPGTLRQGFSQTTSTLSPYAANTSHDLYLIQSIYDSLMKQNSLSHGQLIDWMVLSESNLPLQTLTYPPPPGTVTTIRFTLRNDMFFQDGRKVTAFDVAFSYLSLAGTGSFLGTGAAAMTGVTVLGPNQFDINLNGDGPFILLSLTSLPILPASYWSNAGSAAWNSAVATCTATGAACYPAQYTINSATPTTTNCALTCAFPAADMNVNVAQTGASYDPIANHSLVGSGPFTCGIVTSAGSSTSCSSSGAMSPPVGGYYTLTRFGKGLQPASSISSEYFRSGGTMALWTWSLDTGMITTDFLNFSQLAGCFGSTSPSCSHWMMGIGGCGGTITMPCALGLKQISIVNRFVGLNWVAPFNWQSSPPLGIGQFAPVIYEGSYTLNPQSVAGCAVPFPSGGYDC